MLSLSITDVIDSCGKLTPDWLAPVANTRQRGWHRCQIIAGVVDTGGKLTPAWLTPVAN
jgi:hypothetical protein